VSGHRTSVALEAAFWAELERLAAERGRPLARLVAEIDARKRGGLASALRLYVLDALKAERPPAPGR
jgi:predicted DNA-binding ribbon-helix-helix protein